MKMIHLSNYQPMVERKELKKATKFKVCKATLGKDWEKMVGPAGLEPATTRL